MNALKTAKDVKALLLCNFLGTEDGREVPFHVMVPGSSIMNERSPLARVVEVRQLRTLDSIVNNIEPPAFLQNQVDIVFVREQSPLIADKRHFASLGRPSCG